MQRKAAYLLLALAGLCQPKVYATEGLVPLHFPATAISLEEAEELDDDVYSNDLTVSGEYALTDWFSFYGSGSFRFASYSYEYSSTRAIWVSGPCFTGISGSMQAGGSRPAKAPKKTVSTG